MNLAAAFSAPPPEKTISHLESHIEKARMAYLDRKYQETLYSARSAIKENPEDAEAWKLCSQAHFQLGETQEAEMTILEAIRHEPTNFDIRMDYLRIARETLSSTRYLAELEKARELFPDSSDLVWELARRYHLVERMPVTAGVLYRKVIELESSGSPLSRQAEMELLKLRE
jgi:tetratricopeptide (TPR) repeat protein